MSGLEKLSTSEAPRVSTDRTDVQANTNEQLKQDPEAVKEAKDAGKEAFKDNPEEQSKWEQFVDKAMAMVTMFEMFVTKMIPGSMQTMIKEKYADVTFGSRVRLDKIKDDIEEDFTNLEQALGENEAQKHEHLAIKVAGRLLGVGTSELTNSIEFAARLKNEKNADSSDAFKMMDDMIQILAARNAKNFKQGTVFIVNQMDGWSKLKGGKEMKDFMENTYQLSFVATGDGKMVRGYIPGKGVSTVPLSAVVKGPLSIAAIFEPNVKESVPATSSESAGNTPEPTQSVAPAAATATN